MGNSLPFIRFYTRDWLLDQELGSCSLEAQGLWARMVCVMNECKPRGYLRTNGYPMSPEQIGSATGVNPPLIPPLCAELQKRGVPGIDSSDGAWFSRRMVRDLEALEDARKHGSKGGNPLLVKPRASAAKRQEGVNPPVNPPLYLCIESESVSSSGDRSVRKGGRKPREPDHVWDALVAIYFPSGVAPSQLSRVGAIVKDLKAVHATPEEIKRRAENCRVRFEGKGGPEALVKHWDLCATGTETKPVGTPTPRYGSPAAPKTLEEIEEDRKLIEARDRGQAEWRKRQTEPKQPPVDLAALRLEQVAKLRTNEG